jgi:hypothetical protein
LNLEALHLNGCNLYDEGAINIIDSIYASSNTKIGKIFLNSNHITNKTAKLIAQMLADGNTKVKELGLKWNQITAIGGNLIAAALADNRDLKILDLGWNSIGVYPPAQRNLKKPKKLMSGMKAGEVGKVWGSALAQN